MRQAINSRRINGLLSDTGWLDKHASLANIRMLRPDERRGFFDQALSGAGHDGLDLRLVLAVDGIEA
jgi:hypothetical protein